RARVRARWWGLRLVGFFKLESLPQALQLENERGALRPHAVGLAAPAMRASAAVRQTIPAFHGAIPSAAFSCGAVRDRAAGVFAPAAGLPAAERTRAKISSHEPNAIALPS